VIARRRVGTVALALALALPGPGHAGHGGVVLEQTDQVAYDAPAARVTLERLTALGADTVALVPFVWQRDPQASNPVHGSSVRLAELRAGVRAASSAGLRVAIKPHVWIPGHWAGAVNPGDAAAWGTWFAAYSEALLAYARVGQDTGAEVLFVGTELRQSLAHPQLWRALIARVRQVYDGRLAYAAHGLDDFDRVRFWDALDIAAVTLYPPLDADPAATIAGRADALARRARALAAEVWVAEVGLRSAEGSLPRPWESPSERAASPDPILQARILARWLAETDRPEIATTLIYRWFTDPAAGGPADTDFTPQNKPAAGVLLCAWTDACSSPD
jgi:hypothetical protein